MNIKDQIAQYNITKEQILHYASLFMLEEIKQRKQISSPTETTEYLRTILKDVKYESFHCIFLDTRHRVIEAEEMFRGTIDGAAVYPRVIAQRALELNAAALIIAHNHPSGVNEPSVADQAITRRIKEGLQLLEIRLLDHFVIANNDYVSLASRGML